MNKSPIVPQLFLRSVCRQKAGIVTVERPLQSTFRKCSKCYKIEIHCSAIWSRIIVSVKRMLSYIQADVIPGRGIRSFNAILPPFHPVLFLPKLCRLGNEGRCFTWYSAIIHSGIHRNNCARVHGKYLHLWKTLFARACKHLVAI